MNVMWIVLCVVTAVAGDRPFGLVIHGGAGTITKDKLTGALEQDYRDALTQALNAGYRVLEQGGSSADAVVATIMVMEDSPLFNAGRGAVFASNATNEFDAAIMLGSNRAGACAGVSHVKNPILLARAVMEETPHVLLSGAGAEQLAKQQGLEFRDDAYFFTQRRMQQLKDAQRGQAPQPDEKQKDWKKFGTVGVVALDQRGDLAAGTSTGGLTNKRWGRIGDSPIIGAGTYADNRTCGVSCTGQGEYFMRAVIAYDVAAQMRYRDVDVQTAAKTAIANLNKAGGRGGLIAMDHEGRVVMHMNTPGMYRGLRMSDGRTGVFMFGPEEVEDGR